MTVNIFLFLLRLKKNLNKSEQADLVRHLQKGILFDAQKKLM